MTGFDAFDGKFKRVSQEKPVVIHFSPSFCTSVQLAIHAEVIAQSGSVILYDPRHGAGCRLLRRLPAG